MAPDDTGQKMSHSGHTEDDPPRRNFGGFCVTLVMDLQAVCKATLFWSTESGRWVPQEGEREALSSVSPLTAFNPECWRRKAPAHGVIIMLGCNLDLNTVSMLR